MSPVISGAEISVTFTVHVVAEGTGNLQLTTNLQRSETHAQVWELVSNDYSLGSSFSPDALTTQFNWVKGTFVMRCYGKVRTYTVPTSLIIIQLSSDTGTTLDNIKVTAQTKGSDEFQTLYARQDTKLQSLIDSGVAPGYINIFRSVLNESTALLNKGDTSEALSLLNSLPSSGEPVQSNTESIMLPAIGAAIAVAIVFAFMFLRARSKVSYVRLVVEEQIKDLEGLTIRASKIDRTMSSSLDSVKDKLKRLVGM